MATAIARVLIRGLALVALLAPSLAAARDCRSPRTKIVGGEQAHLSDWPGQAGIRLREQGRAEYVCGGTAIAKDWVLTAAHCIDKGVQLAVRDGAAFEVALGVADLGEAEEKHIYPVAEWRIFPGFRDPILKGDDIALLRLARPYRGRVMALSLSAETDPDLGQLLRVAGFGQKREIARRGEGLAEFQERRSRLQAGAGSQRLLEATVSASDSDACLAVNAYQEVADGPVILPAIGARQICAAPDIPAGARQGSCQGDSGGPLVAYKDGCALQVGIVSWAYGCGSPEDPSVFTRVSAYADWLREVMGEEPQTIEALDAPLIISAADQGTLQTHLRQLLKGGERRLKATLPGGRDVFALGEEVRIAVASEVGGRLYLFDLNPEGHLAQIFPNQFAADAGALSLAAGESVLIPNGPEYGFDYFRVDPPPGDHLLIALVIPDDAPLSAQTEGSFSPTKGFGDAPLEPKPLRKLVAEIEAHLGEAGAGDASRWGLAIVRYRIEG